MSPNSRVGCLKIIDRVVSAILFLYFEHAKVLNIMSDYKCQ